MTNAPDATHDTTLSDRVRHLRLLLAEQTTRDGQENESHRARLTLEDAQRVVTAFQSHQQAIDCLTAEGVEVTSLSNAVRDKAKNARANLRTRRTDLRDADKDLLSILTAPSLAKALESANEVCNNRKSKIVAAFETFRENQSPQDVGSLQIDGLNNLALEVKVQRLQRSLMADAPVTVDEIPNKVAQFKRDCLEWASIRTQVDNARPKFPPDVERFFTLTRGSGASWADLTPAVRAWLDEGTNGHDYRVVRR